ncbi:MAG: UDP-N-acetylmuramoyl-L-alanyl-D-glutamate--2,6-diaminopimelate ligase [Bacteroidetes bacterium]|nr:UDP-N-acetylmuramoyl-L-alanyl-D-glutamate--2,6-diaminopimelate ligase [Bacteroidota bacterium]
MKRLTDILYRVPLLQLSGQADVPVPDFHFDSRYITPGALFVAQKGTRADGNAFVPDALRNGARIVVTEQLPDALDESVTWVLVKDADIALAHIAANFYGNPAQELTIIGVTGTNGKSTITSLLYQLAMRMGYPAALLGTLHVRIGQQVFPATHTTPDARQLHNYFAQMVAQGCQYVFMEVSSHALAQHRVHGIPFAGAIFTNLTHDHLDYHGTFDGYLKAKKTLFDELPAGAFALINTDDKHGKVMVQNTRARLRTYGIRNPADYQARILENTFHGLLLDMLGQQVGFRLMGRFNAANVLATVACMLELELPAEEVLLHASQLLPVAGRFQTLAFSDRITAVVDYAHTPDALKSTLSTIAEMRQGGRILTVVGCGGNRDREKRPLMAAIAAQLSDLVVLTSDNPREEDPRAILDEMLAGVPVSHARRVTVITDRREAIQAASRMVQPGDILLVAGKGHEAYQEIKGQRLPFDDTEEIRNAFQLPG